MIEAIESKTRQAPRLQQRNDGITTDRETPQAPHHSIHQNERLHARGRHPNCEARNLRIKDLVASGRTRFKVVDFEIGEGHLVCDRVAMRVAISPPG